MKELENLETMTSIELFDMLGNFADKRDLHRAIKNMFDGVKIDGVLITQSLNPNKTIEFYVLNELATKMFVASKDIHYLAKITQYWIDKSEVKKLSPNEILLRQAQFMVDQDAINSRQEERIKSLEAKVSASNDQHGFYSILAYANLKGIKLTAPQASVLGKKATKLSQQYEITMGRVPDARWGKVKTYHVDVLDELMSED